MVLLQRRNTTFAVVFDYSKYMEENFDIPWQVTKYENFTNKRKAVYFDVDDFEEIIEYYLFKSLFQEAIDAVHYACKLHPSSVPLMLLQAQLLANFNREADALSLLSKVESMEPNNNDIFLTKGAIYSQLQDYNKAIEEYNKAVGSADDPDYVYCNIAIEYENLGNFDKTLEYLDKALSLNPNNDLAIYEAAYCFDLLSLTEEGIAFFQKLIERNPYSTEAWFNLGVSFINAGMYEKALEAFDYSLAINSEHDQSWFHKGYALSLLERYREAISAYEASIPEDDSDVMKLYYIGECYEKLDDYENAIRYYRKCSQLDPEMADAWVGIGVCELELGSASEAIKYFEHGLMLDNDNINYLCLLGNTYRLLNNKEAAKKSYEQAIEIDPSDEESWLEYAEALHNLGENADAIELLSRGIEALPGLSSILYAMAAILFLSGKPDEGSFCLEEAYAANPENQDHIIKRFPKLNENIDYTEAFDRIK